MTTPESCSQPPLSERLLERYQEIADANDQRVQELRVIQETDPGVIDTPDFAYRLGQTAATSEILGSLGELLLEQGKPDLDAQWQQLQVEHPEDIAEE